uniref:Amino acid transporter transmembrane domain-containing protein n=1 Tax=Kwoniella pini CBS 10737 TaxID=1296096 RepID=A0A1B9I052_9TREE|nr:uncharacterized protein I206_04572 [Kwoniella pini CBS 10737]OCF48885.1 hypothetical protein I206_04572 [Kwoniella pini CBS 10737]
MSDIHTTHSADRDSYSLADRAEVGKLSDPEVGKPALGNGTVVDAVWGNIEGDGPNYRSLSWIKATVLQLKTQVGLGILGLPAAFNILGLVPGIIVIVAVALIVGWSDYVVGIFKLNHPEVYTVADVGYMLFGVWGREILGFAFWLQIVAVTGASFLSMSVAFNTITEHATCTVVWAILAMVIIASLASIQTLSRISWLGWIGLASIMSSVITLMVALGAADKPSLAPATGDWAIETTIAASPSFIDAINAVCIIIFSYAGTPNYFSIVGEMREPKDFTKSVIVGQTLMTTVYLIVASVVYHYAGQYIASPALGTAGSTIKKVCYGLALPGLAVGGLILVHTAAKYVFVRVLRKSTHLSKNTPVHYLVWYACIAVTSILAFIIAEAIPVFNDLLSLIGALLGTLICIQTETYMWVWDNWRAPNRGSTKWYCLIVMNVIFHFIGWFILVAGTYASIVTINNDSKNGILSKPFSCADNSGGS